MDLTIKTCDCQPSSNDTNMLKMAKQFLHNGKCALAFDEFVVKTMAEFAESPEVVNKHWDEFIAEIESELQKHSAMTVGKGWLLSTMRDIRDKSK
jgi:hypothetical protein